MKKCHYYAKIGGDMQRITEEQKAEIEKRNHEIFSKPITEWEKITFIIQVEA